MTELKLTDDETMELKDGLRFILEGIDEDDDRWNSYNSILNKLTN